MSIDRSDYSDDIKYTYAGRHGVMQEGLRIAAALPTLKQAREYLLGLANDIDQWYAEAKRRPTMESPEAIARRAGAVQS